MSELRARRGFTLLVVLWTVAGIAAATLTIRLAAESAVGSAQSEVSATRAYWMAEACVARTIASIDRALQGVPADDRDPGRAWRTLDRLVAGDSAVGTHSRCTTELESNGAKLDLNRASQSDLERLLTYVLGSGTAQRDSLVAAVLDWRDQDDVPHAAGAERPWYARRERPGPSNRPFVAVEELGRVRGFDALTAADWSELQANLGVDEDLIDIAHAPPPLLATLPGFAPNVVAAVLALRTGRKPVADIRELTTMLPAFARDSVVTNYGAIISRATMTPDHWRLTAVGEAGEPAVHVEIALLLAHGNRRVAIVGRREFLE